MRLIDADALEKFLENTRSHLPYQTYISEMELDIRDSALLNLEQMVHLMEDAQRTGHWIHHDELICFEDECSACREYVHICSARYGCDVKKQYNFCPNCGAKMYEEVSD